MTMLVLFVLLTELVIIVVVKLEWFVVVLSDCFVVVFQLFVHAVIPFVKQESHSALWHNIHP